MEDEALKEWKKKLKEPHHGSTPNCYDTLVVLGYSAGGMTALNFAQDIGVKVDLGFTVDPIAGGILSPVSSQFLSKPSNVSKWVNYYQRGDKRYLGLLKGNPISGAENDQIVRYDYYPVAKDFPDSYVNRDMKAGVIDPKKLKANVDWLYSRSHQSPNWGIMDLDTIKNGLRERLKKVPVSRSSFK